MNLEGARNVAWIWLAPLLLVTLVALLQWLPLIAPPTDTASGQPRAPADTAAVLPYTPLELFGREIYLREGCAGCHSQLVRPLAADVARFGAVSQTAGSRFDRPSQSGIRRLGPDLAHIGGKYPDHWHARHLSDPRSVVAGSIMPAFPWLRRNPLSYADLPQRLRALQSLGDPYSSSDAELAAGVARYGDEIAAYFDIHHAEQMLLTEAEARDRDGVPGRLTELDALIAYLQGIGQGPRSIPGSIPGHIPGRLNGHGSAAMPVSLD